MSTTSTVTAREYLRVSFDHSGRERPNDEQHTDNERAATEHGWKLGKPYRDTGSASRYASKRRDEFERLVADLEADTFGAAGSDPVGVGPGVPPTQPVGAVPGAAGGTGRASARHQPQPDV